jgi:hypothetical protein
MIDVARTLLYFEESPTGIMLNLMRLNSKANPVLTATPQRWSAQTHLQPLYFLNVLSLTFRILRAEIPLSPLCFDLIDASLISLSFVSHISSRVV